MGEKVLAILVLQLKSFSQKRRQFSWPANIEGQQANERTATEALPSEQQLALGEDARYDSRKNESDH
eukprot:6460797-Amphidinium_carterae.1